MSKKGFRVLVVEDEAALLTLAQIALEANGYSMVGCSNGAEAITLCDDPSHDFGAILMDIRMPVMDGLDATRKLRAHPRTKNVPIIIVSALASPAEQEEGMKAGADAYLTKPYRFKDLLDILDRYQAKVSI